MWTPAKSMVAGAMFWVKFCPVREHHVPLPRENIHLLVITNSSMPSMKYPITLYAHMDAVLVLPLFFSLQKSSPKEKQQMKLMHIVQMLAQMLMHTESCA